MPFIRIFTLLVCLSIFPGRAAAQPEGRGAPLSRPFKAGAVLYLTNNDYANVALEFRRGLELAAAETDIAVELKVEDDQLSNKLTVAAVQKLLSIDKVDAVFLNEYLQVQAAAPVAVRAGVPVFTMWESSPEIERSGDNVFGLGLWTPGAGEVAARFAWDKLKARKVGLIYDLAAWSESVAGYFKEEFKKLGGTVVFEETLLQGATDFRDSIAKAKWRDIDALFAPVNDHPAVFFRQLKQANFLKPVLSSDQISQEFIDAAGGALEGVYCSNADDRFGHAFAELGQRYQKRYGEVSSHLYFVALAYDALKFVLAAWGSKGHGTLNARAGEMSGFSGVLGPLSLNGRRSAMRSEVMYVVRGNRLIHVP